MAVEERARRELQEALMEAIGPDQTDTLLTYLPPTGWAEVATTRDVQALGAELRGEIAELRGELHAEVAGLRAEMSELGSGLRGEMAEFRGEVAELRSEMAALRMHVYWLMTGLLAFVAIVAADFVVGLLR